ncbi:biliverdin-producing heme oxygenase [Stenotrophomonas maltophilia]
MNDNVTLLVLPRSQRLKAATHGIHDALDKRIMAADIFASRDHYARFLRVQYRFHHDIEALYADPALATLLPGLRERARLLRIANDLSDLQQPLPPPVTAQTLGLELPAALGWLYVAEGSNLGGAVLFKLAQTRLGLSSSFAASHLAAHPDGAARHWRQFTQALDGAELTGPQEQQVIDGATAAFAAVRAYAAQELPVAGQPDAAKPA